MSYPPPSGPDPYGQPPSPGQPSGPGQPPGSWPSMAPVALPPASGKATTALILGLVSFFMCGLFTGIPAIFLGFSARKEIRASQGRLSGDGLALAGIITGVLGTLWSLIVAALLIALVATSAWYVI